MSECTVSEYEGLDGVDKINLQGTIVEQTCRADSIPKESGSGEGRDTWVSEVMRLVG
jgi:hypothetical protein